MQIYSGNSCQTTSASTPSGHRADTELGDTAAFHEVFVYYIINTTISVIVMNRIVKL